MNEKLRRSVINKSIIDALHLLDVFKFQLPPFGYWNCNHWDSINSDCREIIDCRLGWDVTDFGSNNFHEIGRVLFTLRNGLAGSTKYPKEYAEKLLIDPENQRAPAHFHKSKREDIICRIGGNILVQLTKATDEGHPSNKTFPIQLDGCTKRLNPGEIIRLKPGMSVNIPPRHIHQFWGEEGTGFAFEGKRYTLSSEISSVCDDIDDNIFLTDYGVRYPEINEDENRQYYLCHEYPGQV